MISRMIRGLATADRALAKVEEIVLFVLMMTLLLIAVAQVFQRNITDSAPMWVDLILRHMTFAIGLLGASLATHADKQIHIDIIPRLLPEHLRLMTRLVVGIATIGFCVVIIQAGWHTHVMERELPQPLFLGLTSADSLMIIPITFGLIVTHLALRWLFDLGILLTYRQPPDSA
jgi:TRAP-type C4-dicarboxylate transport system permease small subunit